MSPFTIISTFYNTVDLFCVAEDMQRVSTLLISQGPIEIFFDGNASDHMTFYKWKAPMGGSPSRFLLVECNRARALHYLMHWYWFIDIKNSSTGCTKDNGNWILSGHKPLGVVERHTIGAQPNALSTPSYSCRPFYTTSYKKKHGLRWVIWPWSDQLVKCL